MVKIVEKDYKSTIVHQADLSIHEIEVET